jgi:hypothetical protein
MAAILILSFALYGRGMGRKCTSSAKLCKEDADTRAAVPPNCRRNFLRDDIGLFFSNVLKKST